MRTKWKPKKVRHHEWFHISKGLPFRFCGRCGIIILNNKATQQVVDKPCRGLEEEDVDKQY